MELLLGCRRTSLLLFFVRELRGIIRTVSRYLSPSPSALEITLAQTKIQVVQGMLIEKLAGGIVRVQTPIGPRYVMASFLQRIYLLWMFRNFAILPYAVLNGRQQRMIDRMCSEQRFKSIACVNGMDEAPVIGTIERRPANQSLPPRHAVATETGTLAAEARLQGTSDYLAPIVDSTCHAKSSSKSPEIFYCTILPKDTTNFAHAKEWINHTVFGVSNNLSPCTWTACSFSSRLSAARVGELYLDGRKKGAPKRWTKRALLLGIAANEADNLQSGDYCVRTEEGHETWCPAEVFESSYTRDKTPRRRKRKKTVEK